MNWRRCLLVMAVTVVMYVPTAWAGYTFLCAEPGGKRLIAIMGNDIGLASDEKTQLSIDGDGFINDRDGKRMLRVEDDAVRPGDNILNVKLATFDGKNIRHAAGGKVILYCDEKEICPDSQSNRIYSIEGEPLSKPQLVAALYLLKPEYFKLSDEEVAAQKKDAAEETAAEEAKAAADQVAGKWMILSSSGIMEKLGQGLITVEAKKGDAYPVTFDCTKSGGPSWTGVGFYKEISGDKNFWVAYGTAKTIGLCVYAIDGGSLKGKWYPWYNDGDAKNVGEENLSGPESLEGDFKIDSAKAPTTGAAYSGTVTIKPANIVGAADSAKPYNITWTIGDVKIQGIGIRTGKFLFVGSGTGADVNIAKYIISNGSMTSDWFKLGSTEKGSGAATTSN